jgi:hypothetical protein
MLDLKAIVIASASALIIGVTAGWTANGWRLNGKIDRMMAEHSQALAEAGKNAMMESARLQKLKDEALYEANKTAQKNAQSAASARAELDRVRRQLANSVTIGSSTCASTRNYADTLSVVFGECATRLTEVAKDADGHAADSRTFQRAWPRK